MGYTKSATSGKYLRNSSGYYNCTGCPPCAETIYCTLCQAQDNAFIIEFNGVANGTCSDAATVNSTSYTVSNQSDCEYTLVPSECASVLRFDLNMVDLGGGSSQWQGRVRDVATLDSVATFNSDAITQDGNGEVDCTATTTISIDSQTTTHLDFSASEMIVNP